MKSITHSIQQYKQRLSNFKTESLGSPKGSLIKDKDNYVHYDRGKRKGISRDIAFIKKLCRKKYLESSIRDLEQNLSAPTQNFRPMTPQEIIASLPRAYQGHPNNYFFHPEALAWQKKKFPKNTSHPDYAVYEFNGIDYRSMAERIIAEELTAHDIPFHYDIILQILGHSVSPDFLLQNPYTGQVFVWEHFGAFHKENYASEMTAKMDRYLKYYKEVEDRLVTTFEYHIRNRIRIQKMIKEILA